MIIAVVVAAIVVVSHKIEYKTLRLHRRFAVLPFDSGNCLGDGTLDEVQASIRKIIGPRHRRSW